MAIIKEERLLNIKQTVSVDCSGGRVTSFPTQSFFGECYKVIIDSFASGPP